MSEYICYLNGEFPPRSEAKVSALDRAFLMGDAVYEVMRVHRGRMFRVEAHYRRMARGLQELRIPRPFSADEFETLGTELMRRNDTEAGLVYVQVSRGATDRTHFLPTDIEPCVFGYAVSKDLPAWKSSPEGAKVITTRDLRWARCEIKTTMLLPNSLAKQEARDAGAYEAVLVADDGVVREGSSSNLFIVCDGKLMTHPLNGRILPGITRRIVIELAGQEGVPVVEETFNVDQLRAADEVFLAGTGTDICPVVTVDDTTIGDGRIGPLSARFMERYMDLMDREASA